ncbi:hypothetical protein T4A_2913 [Trichinella pseudospiralis]|nr:hypothetical protein T4E_10047 [Trichinella pseudospiralis]KRY69065.1 hypothetical protein T4A_2913 [Trichinella pseudospiralis]KRY86228.1 hypothetical protein T4D_6343 [Trichinella pseudospiralis]KRZ38665.1 hypothetical protein T4C_1821 [Trichinella pseudospiralis]
MNNFPPIFITNKSSSNRGLITGALHLFDGRPSKSETGKHGKLPHNLPRCMTLTEGELSVLAKRTICAFHFQSSTKYQNPRLVE